MIITDYFIVFYADNKPIADFDFSIFKDPDYYICPTLKNGHYTQFYVYSRSNCEMHYNIPRYVYHVYWPISLLRLYNHLVFHHNIRSPKTIKHSYHSAYYGDLQGEDYVGVYEIWRDDDRNSNRYFFGDDAYFRYRDNFDRFRKRFKSIIVMK